MYLPGFIKFSHTSTVQQKHSSLIACSFLITTLHYNNIIIIMIYRFRTNNKLQTYFHRVQYTIVCSQQLVYRRLKSEKQNDPHFN